MAGRIPQFFIDDLLSRIDVVDLIDRHVPLKKAGKEYKACCPFHEEKTPSFTVSQDKQFYHCFGCGMHGTAISFLMEYDQMEFRDAVEQLAEMAGVEIPVESKTAPRADDAGPDLYQFLERACHYYQAQLRNHDTAATAIAYLKQRGLSGEIAQRYAIGFVPDGWDNILGELGKTEIDKKALMTAGLLSSNEKGRTYDRFRNRIMFPIHDYRGRVVGFGGRVMDDSEPKYLNSPETPAFHKGAELYGLYAARKAIRDRQVAIVVEGYMDVVALAQHGIDNAVATLGTATTRQHLDRLFRHCPHIIFCFDGDRAGREAAWRALETSLPLMQDGRQVSFMFLPEGEDPDSLVRTGGKESFLQEMEKGIPLPDHLLNELSDRVDLSRLDGGARLSALANPLMAKLPNGLLRELIISRLAKLTGTDAQTVKRHTEAPPQADTDRYSRRARSPVRQPPPSAVRQAITILLHHPALAKHCNELDEISDSGEPGFALLADIAGTIQSHPGLNTAALLERYRGKDDFNTLEKLVASDHMMEAGNIEETFLALLAKLRQRVLELQTEALLSKSEQSGLSGEEKSLLNRLLAGSSET